MAPLAASNPRIRRLRRLSGRRSARVDEGAFLLEGPLLIGEALRGGIVLEGVYVETSAADEAVIDDVRRSGVGVHLVGDGVLARISDVVTPRPLLAVAPRAPADAADLADAARASSRPLVVLVAVRDPGNLGTILRAAEAAGAAGVVCTKGSVDPWSPKAVRSSAGSVLRVPVAADVDTVDTLRLLGDRDVTRLGTVVRDAEPYEETDLAGAVAFVLGGEADGLDVDALGEVDRVVTIPMEGGAESLNVAMASSVLCFEALRQRRVAGRETGEPTSEPIGRRHRPATR